MEQFQEIGCTSVGSCEVHQEKRPGQHNTRRVRADRPLARVALFFHTLAVPCRPQKIRIKSFDPQVVASHA